MKQVTIENVKARIAKLQSRGNAEYSLGLTLNEEFELACLRMLADSMGGVDDDVRNVVGLLENNEWAEHCTKTEVGQRLESEITRLVGQVQQVPVHVDGIAEQAGIDPAIADAYMQGYRDAELRQAQTDNTAQQFEALATTGKSEHLLNAERIAREAQALAERLNATSDVHPRVSGWSERQQRIISYALWRLMHSAYEEASKAGQRNCKDDFDRFMQDAKDAEEIREEFTSAGSGKP